MRKKLILIFLSLFFCSLGYLQPLQAQYRSGSLGVGIRQTVNFFPKDKMSGLGIGGQLKLGLGKYLNTEWIFDYINSTGKGDFFRKDYHIGWDVQFALGREFGDHRLVPYLLAGHCFDLTKVTIRSKEVSPLVFSSAAQIGAGVSKFLGRNTELSFQGQYMMHLGKDVHIDGDYPNQSIEIHKGASLNGHILLTAAFNIYFYQIWNR